MIHFLDHKQREDCGLWHIDHPGEWSKMAYIPSITTLGPQIMLFPTTRAREGIYKGLGILVQNPLSDLLLDLILPLWHNVLVQKYLQNGSFQVVWTPQIDRSRRFGPLKWVI